nr:MAG TPA: Portal [Bacteriophage sp.]
MWIWPLKGRRKIYTDEKEINSNNIIKVLSDAYSVHRKNQMEMQYLIDFEAGIQPLQRPKIVRPEINIEVTDNVANYVTEFKLAYFWGTPAMLIQRSDKDAHNTSADSDDAGISAMNEMLANGCSIGYKNQELGNFVEKVGIGYRLVDIKTDFSEEKEALVDICTLDPRFTFCIYSNSAKQKKLLGVTFRKIKGRIYYTCFTKQTRYEISQGKIKSATINPMESIPIVEYERAVDRTGCFERHLSDCTELNTLVSDFANLTAQQTQEIWWGNDVDFPVDPKTKEPVEVKSGQWVLTSTTPDGKTPQIKALSNAFDTNATLTAIDTRWRRILQKCKVPTQQDSEGGGSTGTAMDMSSGWSAAETEAVREEQMASKAQREELRLIIKALEFVPETILPEKAPIRGIHVGDINFHFSRRKNYDMSVKANALSTLIKTGVHGRHALKFIDGFEDTEATWNDSREMIESIQQAAASGNTANEENQSDRQIDQLKTSPITGKV